MRVSSDYIYSPTTTFSSNNNKTAQYIANSKTAQKVLLSAEKNPSLFKGIFAFLIATILKPSSIILTPTPKEDKKYAIARSISTGVADLAVAFAIFIPLNKSIDMAGRKLFNSKGIFKDNPEMCTKFKSLFNRVVNIALLPVFVWLKFKGIDPVVDAMAKAKGKRNEGK